MGNSFTSLHYHIVFSTKRRRLWIAAAIEERVWAYMGGIARENKMKPVQIGGVDDHIHVLIGAPPTLAPSRITQLLKGGSSRWIHVEFPALAEFGWQDGYSAYAVSKSAIPAIANYIKGQREHHRKTTFTQEYLALLARHEIAYDERYVFD
ncbi:MAG: IS200/IS605 family transposase [Thermoflexales bacterium]